MTGRRPLLRITAALQLGRRYVSGAPFHLVSSSSGRLRGRAISSSLRRSQRLSSCCQTIVSFHHFRSRTKAAIDSYPSVIAAHLPPLSTGTNEIGTDLSASSVPFLQSHNLWTTSHSEHFICCLPLSNGRSCTRETILSNRICGSRRRIPPANLRPQQTLLGRCLFSTAPPPPACSHLQPDPLRYSPPLCSISTVSTSLPIVVAPPPRSDREQRSTSRDRRPCSPKLDLRCWSSRGGTPHLCARS
ncbi:hypothetical protein GW17_00023902 [Ensete ventricosum]|nr:hypothetical protein GW17_00023902 [Ensete ventricosum]